MLIMLFVAGIVFCNVQEYRQGAKHASLKMIKYIDKAGVIIKKAYKAITKMISEI